MEEPATNPMEPGTDSELAASAVESDGPINFDPRGYVFEEEFASELPRPIPAELKTGSFRRRQLGVTYTLMTLGIMCLLAHSIPFVKGLSHYILPLAYLNWIGGVLLALGACKFLMAHLTLGPYKYVRDGIPVVGRVRSVIQTAEGTKDQPQFRYAANVDFQDPESGLKQFLQFPDRQSWPLSQISLFETTLKPGDLVTLVAMPGKVSETISLYGFLGLNPEREFVLKNGEPLKATSPSTAVMVACAVFAALAVVLMAFDVMFFSFPLDNIFNKNAQYTAIFGGGGALLAALFGISRIRRNAASSPNTMSYLMTFLFSGLFGGIAGTLLLCILNSQLDRGRGTLEPIEIVKYWQKTHNFIIRNYEVEYRLLGEAATTKTHIRFSQIEDLADAHYGALDVGPGAFGFRWSRTICPATWTPEEDVPDVDAPVYQLTLEVRPAPNAEPTAKNVVRLKPVVKIKADEYTAPPDELVHLMVTELQRDFPMIELAPPPAAPAKAE